MSNHKVETFLLKELTKHPNADSLSLAKIADTEYTYVARTEEWLPHIGKLVAWVPPDSCVDLNRPQFSFLMPLDKPARPKDSRIRAKKIRGIVSYGLMVLAPEGLKEGDDAAEALGVTHYEPDETGGRGGDKALGGVVMGGETVSAPTALATLGKYDIENFLKYGKKVFQEGELVSVTEKIHGANSRYSFIEGQMYCGSRTEWKREYSKKLIKEDFIEKFKDLQLDEAAKTARIEEIWAKYSEKLNNPQHAMHKRNMWWDALHPNVERFCKSNEGWIVYGETYGAVQSFNYGAKKGEVFFAAFDIKRPDGVWLDSTEFWNVCNIWGIPTVPKVAEEPFDPEKIKQYAEGPSLVANATNIREGVVVKPVKERWAPQCGRVILKCINPAYLEKN